MTSPDELYFHHSPKSTVAGVEVRAAASGTEPNLPRSEGIAGSILVEIMTFSFKGNLNRVRACLCPRFVEN